MKLDCFGRPGLLGYPLGTPWYIEDSSTEGIVYKCHDDRPSRLIWRETTKNGILTREFSYGPWEDRASLTYAPISATIDV